MKLLFILKKFEGYGYSNGASGLYNSAQFVVDMLNASGVSAGLVQVTDNNDIDREVTKAQPDFVIIEAFWVVPEKFDVLVTLHPRVRWIIRGHSNLPFLANEGMAIDWVFRYQKHPNVSVAFNSEQMIDDLKGLVPGDIGYLPNYYPVTDYERRLGDRSFVAVGCFGAIRPLKNQLVQAVAAIQYANSVGKKLEFHINGTRCEGGGQQVLRNLRALFNHTGHELVEWPWLPRPQFLGVVSQMDFALAVSFSETFCITAADAVSSGVPLICSKEVPWAAPISVVGTTDAEAIAQRFTDIERLGRRWWNITMNRMNLRKYAKNNRKIWLKFFGEKS